MKISSFIEDDDLRGILDELSQISARPPRSKGSNAIKVNAYIVRSHWRRRYHPNVIPIHKHYKHKRHA